MDNKPELERLRAEILSLSNEVQRLRGLVARKNDVLRQIQQQASIGRIAPPLTNASPA